jgi:hypothetical protein
MIDETGLMQFWKTYIDTDIYRVMSEEYLPQIEKSGLDPHYDPFSSMYPDINSLFELMIGLENKGIIYTEHWRDGPRTASQIIEISRISMASDYLDFVADLYQALKFRDKWGGGALANAVFNYSSFLQDKDISPEERKLADNMLSWSMERRSYENRILSVSGSNPVFETAKLLLLPMSGEKETVDSPYGSFGHFRNSISDRFEQLKPYLRQSELSYLRVVDRIQPEDIKII